MKIKQVLAREIYDSRGWPTVECELILEDNTTVKSSVPSGKSRGAFEAYELRDQKTRLMGQGVQQAIDNIKNIIAPVLIDKEPNMVQMDVLMLELDGTENKSHLGANAIITTSMAITKAQAVIEDMPLYEFLAYLCGFDSIRLPVPMFNLINGGAHADNNLQIQEFMVVPMGMSSFSQAMEVGVTVFHVLEELLHQQGKKTTVGDEGGFAPQLNSETEALDCLMMAVEIVQKNYEGPIMIALDVAASQFYDSTRKLYNWHGALLESDELIEWYAKIAERYPIYSLEDGLSEHDWDGWERLSKVLKNRVRIVGDDLFATSPQRIWEGIERDAANVAIIKPNQIGTVTECLQAIKLCREYNMNTIVSHRSGETNDSFIADLAVAVSADQIKAGGCSRGERLAKYNRLLRIEEELLFF